MPAETGEPLSNREQEILECVVAGMVNKEIAGELHISENTVKVHLRNVYTKLGVSTRTEAATEAIRRGLVMIPGTTETVSELPTAAEGTTGGIAAIISAAGKDEVETAVSPNNTPPISNAHPNRWLLVVGILLLGAITIGALLVLNNRSGTLVAEPTPEPFAETSLPNNWLQSRPIPVTAAKTAVTSFGLDLFLISGEQDGAISNTVYLYDTRDRTWETRAEKPTAVTEATAAELGGVIFVPGGLTAAGQPTNIVEVYSPANDAWGQVASLPIPASGGLALTAGGLIYFIGGFNGTEYLNTVYAYNPGADSWRPLTRMTQPRAFAAGGVIGNNLYVVGGFDGEAELDTCEVYNFTNDSWSSCTPMLAPRGGAGTAVLVHKLYVIGGGIEEGNPIEFSEVFDPSDGTWSLLNTPMLGSNGRWANVGVTSIENRIYALGGIRSDGLAVDDNLAYAPLIYQTFIPAASGGGSEE